MGNINIEQSILQAIDIVLSDRIKNAGYNKTIQAIVVECTDPTIGQYRVQYQDSFLNAYSDNTDTSYTKGTSVYVLIPNGDMSQNKMIIGSVDKLGTDYVNAIKLENKYAAVGNNVLSLSNELFGLSSFKTLVKVLYAAGAGGNLIQVDNDAAAIYLNGADCIIIKAKIKNNLPVAQRSRGNFGIIYALDFKDNNTGEEVTRYYILDVDQMEGNPYILTNYTDQVGIFPIDGLNFVRIKSISIFSKDFPNQDDSADNDIFIKNLSLVAANENEESEINGYSLNLLTPQGYIFGAGTAKEINALLRVKGELATYTEGMEFYWFVLNVNVTTQSLYYNSYAGQGWKCLNDYNVIQDAETDGSGTVTVPAVLQFIPASSTLEIKKSDLLTLRVRYKCVLVYNSNVLSKEITFVNLDADYTVSIESSDGIEFFKDVGETTLTCKCKYQDTEVSSSDLIYSWCLVNSLGNFETIGSNSSIHILARDMFDFSFYKCSVFAKNTGSLIGTAAIKITNSLEDNNRYHVIINNGTQVFKYNERGLSPASKQLDDPIDIPALTFTVYNQKGLEIDESILSNYDIVWKVPAKRTLLKIDGNQEGEMDENEEYIYYHNFMSLVYSIMDNYSIYSSNNDIELIINYNDMILTAKTDFTFLKEGLAGTNGTDFVCKIVPNVVTGYEVPENPTVYYDGSSLDFNWQNAGKLDGKWFKAELWHNGELIYSGTDKNGSSSEGKTVTISDWSILKNKYKYDLSDKSDFQVTKNLNAGTWSFAFSSLAMSVSSQISEWRPADIVKVTLKYDGLTYYATLPLIFCRVWQYNSYRVRLEDNTGFQRVLYSSSGLNPEYYNNNNFKVITEQKISNQWTDISLNSGINYKWYCNGIVKKQSGTSWISDVETENEYGQTSGKWLLNYSNNDSSMPINERKVRPADSYDGLCVTVGLSCLVKNDNSNIGWIHIPIHMSLNRFENANLNTWDGNSVNLGGDNGGMIIAPQVGAGVKDSNNRFTGMFIGTAKDPNQTASSITTIDAEHWKDGLDVGLFGYAAGARSIFLDAKTGKAEFGTQGAGQIILDPSSNQALIRSGNYDPNTNKTGMQINLSEPSINYGSGNFTVDQNGVLTAKSARLNGIQISSDSTYGGQTVSLIKNLLEAYANQQVNNYKAVVDLIVQNLQAQIDDQIMSWYYDYKPTLNNYPASAWCPALDKDDPLNVDKEGTYELHEGDIFFDKSEGIAYRFLNDPDDGWGWALIKDTLVTEALEAAAHAQDTADGKRRVFVAQPTASSIYDVGDLWVNATYSDANISYDNEILRCRQSKVEGAAFSIGHWTVAATYTDKLNTFIQEEYNETIKDLQGQIDQQLETWYQDSDPSTNWSAKEKSDHEGDLWYKTLNGLNTTWRWDGTQWIQQNVPKQVFDDIDGRRRVFVSQPTNVQLYDVGDLWVNATYANGTTTIYQNDLLRCQTAKAKNAAFNINHWLKASKYTDDTTIENFLDGYTDTLTSIRGQIDRKINTWYQDTDPASSSSWIVTDDHEGDLWYCTKANSTTYPKTNQTYRRSGNTWVEQAAPKLVFDAIDGKAQIFSGNSFTNSSGSTQNRPWPPYDKGDLWFDGVADNTGDIYTCVTARTSGSGSADDWKIRNKYMAEINNAKDATIVNDTIHYLATSASSGVTRNTSGWDTVVEISETLKYLWTYHTYLYGSGRESFTDPVILGRYGDKGNAGQNLYVWTKYADTPTSGMSDSPTDKKYIGIAVNKTSATESTNYSDYTWSLFKGDHGISTASVYLYQRATTQPSTKPSGTFTYTFSNNTLTAKTGANFNGWTQAIPSGSNTLWMIVATASSDSTTDDISGTEFSNPIQIEGVDGTNVTITSKSVKYQQGNSGTTKPTGTWQNDIPSLTQGKYLWTQTIVNYSSGDSTLSYSVSRNPVNGTNGVSPTVTGTTVEYQQSTGGTTPPTGTWSNTAPAATAGQYMWTRTTVTYSDSATAVSYSVSKNGTNGTSPTSYSLIVSHAAIVKSLSGTYTPGSITVSAKKQTGSGSILSYIGRIYILTYNGSSWTNRINEDAATKTYTVPSGITQIRCSLYIAGGTTTLLDQQTVPIVSDGATGPQGPQGVQGPKGDNGVTYYTWLKYATTPTSGMSDNPTGKDYIGLAYNKTTSTESSNYSDYTWSKIKGEKGDQGIQGPTGPNGETLYTWVKYADNAQGSSMSDDPTGKTYIGLAYNKTSQTESTIPSDYTWSLIKGSDGKDAYTVVLTNENYTFVGDTSKALPSNTSTGLNVAECSVVAYKGTTAITPTIGTITGKPTGMSSSISGTTFTITVANTMVTKNGVLTVPVTVDSKTFNMKFTYSLALKGEKGADGYNQVVLSVYQRASSVNKPSPASNTTYTFSTGTYNKSISNWYPTISLATSNASDATKPCWVSSVTLVSQSNTITLPALSSWSEPVKLVENGATGAGIVNIYPIYYRSKITSTPTAPTGLVTTTSTAPNPDGWTKAIPILDKTNYKYLFTCDQIEHTTGTRFTCTSVVRDYTDEKVFELDASLYREEVFNRLTNNLTKKALVFDEAGDGLYVNATYINSGKLTVKNSSSNVLFDADIDSKTVKIGGFIVDANYIRSGETNSTSDGAVTLSNTNFTRNINGSNKTGLRLAIGGKFGVKKDGTIYATGVDISGAIHAKSLTIGDNDHALGISDVSNLQDSLNGKASTQDASDAKKIATNYLTSIDNNNGIKIHAQNNTTSNYTQINANGMYVYKGGNQVAQFSDTTIIGKISTAHTTIDSESLMLSYNTNDPIFKIQGNSNYNITRINRTIRAGSDYCTIPTGLNSEMISVVQSETVELLNTTYITPVTFEYIPKSGKLTIIGGNPLSSRDFIISYISNIDNIALIYGSLNTEVLGADPNDGYCGTNLGFNVNARGPFSTAIGKSSIAEGSYSFAVGDAVMSSGICSFAAGRNTKALGQYTHALGYRTTAGQSDGDSDKLGNYSHAEGYVSNTYGNYSHAEGYMTIAYGLASHTEGYNTSAIADYQTVVGKNNLLSQDGLFVVGNGTDWNNRSNAFEVKSNGNIYISGNAYMSNNLIATQAWVTAQRNVQINSNFTGKMRLGNCLIQWGYISDIGCANGATKAVTVNFPTAYNTYVPGVVCTPNMGNTSHLGGYCTLTVENLSRSGFTARWRNANTAAGTTFSIQAFWIAIGNITI